MGKRIEGWRVHFVGHPIVDRSFSLTMGIPNCSLRARRCHLSVFSLPETSSLNPWTIQHRNQCQTPQSVWLREPRPCFYRSQPTFNPFAMANLLEGTGILWRTRHAFKEDDARNMKASWNENFILGNDQFLKLEVLVRNCEPLQWFSIAKGFNENLTLRWLLGFSNVRAELW